MIPKLEKIDHIHINVKNREISEIWYKNTLGLLRSPDLEFWAEKKGPLTLTDENGNIHLALFEYQEVQNTTIAFSASGHEYIKWYNHLRESGLPVNHNDHQISWSIYFRDPDGNPFEITTYDYEQVKRLLI